MSHDELLHLPPSDRAASGHALLCADVSDAAPVFLHTGWRTRGTWVWSCFRALDRTTCFYEPLAEDLARLSPAAIEARSPKNWASGHPLWQRPYFTEFRPLLKTAAPGVLRYDPAFAVTGFFAEPDAEMPELHDYIDLLLRTAHADGGQPVLKFCRSLGRIGWMQRNFPQAIHIALMRNPLAQFVSAQWQFQRHENPYFLAMPLLLLATHRDLPEVAAAVRRLAVALPSLPSGGSLDAGMAACVAHLWRTDPIAWYRGFLAFWTVTAASIPDTIDLIVDSDLLTNSGEYRHQCEIDIATLTGRTVDFGDAQRGSNKDATMLATSGLRRADLWRVHDAAEALLADRSGDAWADSPLLARVGAMLGYASLLSTSPLHAFGLAATVHWDAVCAEAAALAADARRLVNAERELAAVYASRSWRATALLRWLSRRLQAFIRLVHKRTIE
jgi:hypothetical protein